MRRRSTATPRPRRGSSTPAATTGATARWSTLHGLGFRDDAAARSLAGDVLRRRADPRLAGARAGRRSGPAAARRADQPPRHRLARVARAASRRARRRDRAGRPRPLVPRGGRDLGAGARGRAGQVLPRHLARLAPGEGGAGARAGARDRAPAGGDRAARAVRHPVPRRHAGAPGAVARQEAREDRPDRPRPRRRRRRLQFAFKPPERSGRVVFELLDGRVSVGAAHAARRRPSCGSSGASTSRWSVPNGAGKTTLIEALAGLREIGEPEPGGGPLVEGKLRTGHNVKLGFLSQHAEELAAGTARTVLEAAGHLTGLTPQQGPGAARAGSCSPARTPRSRSTASPAASAGGCRWPSSCTRAPTS